MPKTYGDFFECETGTAPISSTNSVWEVKNVSTNFKWVAWQCFTS